MNLPAKKFAGCPAVSPARLFRDSRLLPNVSQEAYAPSVQY